MKIYSKEYLLGRILECKEGELLAAKVLKAVSCTETRIPKKDGYRLIVSIGRSSILRKLQENLLKNFLSQIPISVAAKGFVKRSSYIDFLEEHIGHEFFLRLDIKNFFDSITEEMVFNSLRDFVEEAVLNEVVELCTWEGRVPQGFVTSPALSNIVFRRIDQRIRKYCRAYHKEMKRSIYYTRYADDMLFSAVGFDFRENKNFKRMIVHILNENGFECNERKTIYARNEISLSGYVIYEDVHLSRKKLHNINEVIYQFSDKTLYEKNIFKIDRDVNLDRLVAFLNTKKLKKADGEQIVFSDAYGLIHYVAGWRSYLIQISRTEHGNTGYDKQIGKKIKKLEMILEYLSQKLEVV